MSIIMPVLSPGVASPLSNGIAKGAKPGKTENAAEQFESLLIEQMLKSARAGGGGEWFGEDSAAAPLAEMAEQQFAQLLASNGGVGLAKMVSAGLKSDQAKVLSKGEPLENPARQSVAPSSRNQI